VGGSRPRVDQRHVRERPPRRRRACASGQLRAPHRRRDNEVPCNERSARAIERQARRRRHLRPIGEALAKVSAVVGVVRRELFADGDSPWPGPSQGGPVERPRTSIARMLPPGRWPTPTMTPELVSVLPPNDAGSLMMWPLCQATESRSPRPSLWPPETCPSSLMSTAPRAAHFAA
jgi:hypothetical protein